MACNYYPHADFPSICVICCRLILWCMHEQRIWTKVAENNKQNTAQKIVTTKIIYLTKTPAFVFGCYSLSACLILYANKTCILNHSCKTTELLSERNSERVKELLFLKLEGVWHKSQFSESGNPKLSGLHTINVFLNCICRGMQTSQILKYTHLHSK